MVHNFVLFILLIVTSSTLFAFEYYIHTILLFFTIGIIVLFRLLFHTRKIFFILLCFICLGIFIFLFIHQKIDGIKKEYIEGFIYAQKTTQSIQGIVVEFPQYRFSNNQYLVRVQNTNTYIHIFTPLFKKFEYLDTLEIIGIPSDIRAQDEIWHRYYQRLGVQYIMLYPPNIKSIPHTVSTFEEDIKRKLFEFKKFIRSKSVERFSSHASALVLGMLLGEKNELSKEEKEIFNTSQLSHILVVSGYNVSLVVLLLFWIMSSVHRYIKVASVLTAITLFVLLIGYDSSVVRAGLMGALLVIARILNRPKSGVNALCIVALIMILHNPLVIFDAGFHLSFIATYSLLIIPQIKKFQNMF